MEVFRIAGDPVPIAFLPSHRCEYARYLRFHVVPDDRGAHDFDQPISAENLWRWVCPGWSFAGVLAQVPDSRAFFLRMSSLPDLCLPVRSWLRLFPGVWACVWCGPNYSNIRPVLHLVFDRSVVSVELARSVLELLDNNYAVSVKCMRQRLFGGPVADKDLLYVAPGDESLGYWSEDYAEPLADSVFRIWPTANAIFKEPAILLSERLAVYRKSATFDSIWC